VSIGANLTISLHARNGPLIGRIYGLFHEREEATGMRLIVTLTAALTVLFLVLPAHP